MFGIFHIKKHVDGSSASKWSGRTVYMSHIKLRIDLITARISLTMTQIMGLPVGQLLVE
jgi:hypothetical protein